MYSKRQINYSLGFHLDAKGGRFSPKIRTVAHFSELGRLGADPSQKRANAKRQKGGCFGLDEAQRKLV